MVFIIDPNLSERIKKLVEFSESNPLHVNDLLDMMNGSKKFAGDTKGYYLIDRFGTKIVYTIEIMPEYKLRHLSISFNNGKSIPHPVIVQEIINLFGFKSELYDCMVEIESRENNQVGILNVAEKITD